MKKKYYTVITAGVALFLINGCAGNTTDPRKGGLFSYDPDAYEQRLATRENKISSIENDTKREKEKTVHLKNKLSREKRKLRQYQ